MSYTNTLYSITMSFDFGSIETTYLFSWEGGHSFVFENDEEILEAIPYGVADRTIRCWIGGEIIGDERRASPEEITFLSGLVLSYQDKIVKTSDKNIVFGS